MSPTPLNLAGILFGSLAVLAWMVHIANEEPWDYGKLAISAGAMSCLARSLELHRWTTGSYPKNVDELQLEEPLCLVDYWKEEIRYRSAGPDHYEMRSCGLDRHCSEPNLTPTGRPIARVDDPTIVSGRWVRTWMGFEPPSYSFVAAKVSRSEGACRLALKLESRGEIQFGYGIYGRAYGSGVWRFGTVEISAGRSAEVLLTRSDFTSLKDEVHESQNLLDFEYAGTGGMLVFEVWDAGEIERDQTDNFVAIVASGEERCPQRIIDRPAATETWSHAEGDHELIRQRRVGDGVGQELAAARTVGFRDRLCCRCLGSALLVGAM